MADIFDCVQDYFRECGSKSIAQKIPIIKDKFMDGCKDFCQKGSIRESNLVMI